MNKDTLTFAIILSIIDFILSGVFITGIGLVLHWLPSLNNIAKLEDEELRSGH